jgi:hypothetical protein
MIALVTLGDAHASPHHQTAQFRQSGAEHPNPKATLEM